MKKILFINACVRPGSRTYLLAREVLKRLDGKTEEVKLCDENICPLDWEQLEKRDRLIMQKNFSDPLFKYANQFVEADEILIAAPCWDLAFPSVLRVYFEHITITGLTFEYSPEGVPTGLCNAGRIIYVATSGDPFAGQRHGYDYIKDLANSFYGIPDVMCFKAENLDIKGADVNGIIQKAIQDIETAGIYFFMINVQSTISAKRL